MNLANVPDSPMVSGILFHSDGPATEKDRRPYPSRLYRGIVESIRDN